MGHYKNLRSVDKDELAKKILLIAKLYEGQLKKESAKTIFVECNEVKPIIQAAIIASNEMKTHDVFFQPNSFFPGDLEVYKFATEELWSQYFQAFCNFFDNYRETLIIRMNKHLFNYSKNMEETKVVDYPDDLKMILIIENFNFWDLNSQREMLRLSEKNSNIVVIGQLRTNFAFASKHIDVDVSSRASAVALEY